LGNKRNRENCLEYVKNRLIEERIRQTISKLKEDNREGTDKKVVEIRLNNIDRKIQEILTVGESRLASTKREGFSAELKSIR